MKIIFDLDGTLICSKRRLHQLFCFLIGGDKLDFAAYWDLKFSGQSNQDILTNVFGYSGDEVQQFVEHWMGLIEDERYLGLDSIIESVPVFLSELNKEHELYLCTARQSVVKTIKQLKYFSIFDLFDEVFVTEQLSSKKELLKNSGLKLSSEDWIIGDTGHDILTGKALGLKTCAVLSGFMNEASLVKYSPDIVLSDVTNFRG